MFGLIAQVFEHILVGACLTAFSMVLFSLALLLRLFPRLLGFARLCLRELLTLSFRLYRMILTWLDTIFQYRLGVNLLTGYRRVLACLFLSLILGLLIVTLAGLSISGWSVILSLLHGLIVGLTWDEIEEPEGFRLGVKSQ